MLDTFVPTPVGRVAVVDHGGAGPDLLLLHASGGTLVDWELVRPHLLGRHVVAMDLPWHGRSEDGPDVRLESFTNAVESVVDHLALQNPVVAGHSLGGMVAAVYGARRPDCPGVVNLDGHGLGTPDQYVGVDPERVAEFHARVSEVAESTFNAFGPGDDAWLEQQTAPMRRQLEALGVSEELIRAWLARMYTAVPDGRWQRRPSARYARLLYDYLPSVNLLRLWRECCCPLLVYNCVKPDQSSSVPGAEQLMAAYRKGLERDLREIERDLPNVRVLTVDATHSLIFENPEDVAYELLALSR